MTLPPKKEQTLFIIIVQTFLFLTYVKCTPDNNYGGKPILMLTKKKRVK